MASGIDDRLQLLGGLGSRSILRLSRTGASQRRCRGRGRRGAPAARSARTNDVEAGKARRILGWPGEAEQRFAVAVAEQEDKALQVLAQLLDAVGGVADELVERGAQTGRVAGQPFAEELQHLRELGRLAGVQLEIGHGIHRLPGWVAWAL
jgi:hypothetical protein